MRPTSRRVDVSDLNGRDRAQMFQLFCRYFEGADQDRFESDLAQKDWIIQLLAPDSAEICGFSTQALLSVEHEGQVAHAIFSGDTIVDPAWWCETALMREWGRLVVELTAATRPRPLYWFLISKGYKTYRFLPVFFREFYPRYDRHTPDWAVQMLDAFGRSMFGDSYDADTGLIIATPHKDRLRPGVAEITHQRLRDPHVQFFLNRNPAHADGNELCCLARLDVANFTRAGIRLLDPENQPQPLGSPTDLSGV